MAARRVLVLLVALAGCGSSQAATTPRHVSDAPGPCAPAGDTLIAADGTAEIYQSNRTVYGCAGRGGHGYRLGVTQTCINADRVGPVTLSGAVAAYGVQRCGVDTGTAQVVVRRLTDGKVLHASPAVSRVPGAESYATVATVVVKRDGSTAWIGGAHSIVRRGSSVTEVRRFDTHGQTLLDHGAGIAVGSLRLHGSRLSWTHAHSSRSANLS
ncbi:MAG TPA: hypothetical protein VGH24_05540 [Solirubrobacteraceae bacterium]